jgi:uncharacterized membrane-anchored protein YjiN (DUF445 family)
MDNTQTQPSEQEVIDAGRRVEQFIKDPAVQEAIARLATQYYSDFKSAKTADAIKIAHAKSSMLDEFINELQVPIDRGEAATIQRRSREAREARTPKKPS